MAINRVQIKPKGEQTAEKANKTDIIKQAAILIENSKNDVTKRAAAVSEIALLLAAEKSKASQGLYLDEICKSHNIRKGILTDEIKKLERAKAKRLKENDPDSLLTKLDKHELFLSKRYSIKYNVISMEYEIIDKTDPEAQQLDEFAILRTMRKENFDITERNLIEILKSPYVDKYNPITDYFNSLTDYNPHKEPDYIKNLCKYLTMQTPDRFYTQFKKHLVRVIAGAFEKDFNKQVLVLVGDGMVNQNSGKSTFIRWLTPPKLYNYYIEDLPQDKDGLIALTDNFIINLDELESLSRYDINKLKSVLSKETVKVRPPYGRRAISIPRRASFFGSTNELTFLSDLTGNVRWLVFKFADVKRPINWNYKNDFDINDIWREAYYLYNSKDFNYKLTRQEIEENEEQNNEFLTLPPEYDLIIQRYSPGTKDDNNEFYTATDFVKHLSDATNHTLKLNAIRLGKVLRRLGYKQVTGSRNEQGNPIKGYYIKFNVNYQPPAGEPYYG